ncbi:MAG TPA: hypothetical protein VKX46_17245 [Ktedonobacteraceae bacterium]|nr:hypothetical protein [Ktedonobacteraceae bacterium]
MYTIIIIIAVVLYMIVRQFQEQPVMTWKNWILPTLVVVYTYTNVTAQLAKPIIDPAYLLATVALGLLAGLLIGFYRGSMARLRVDYATGTILAKANALSLILWILLLALRIGAGALFYSGMEDHFALLALFGAFTSTLFVGNIVAEKAYVTWRSMQYGVPAE